MSLRAKAASRGERSAVEPVKRERAAVASENGGSSLSRGTREALFPKLKSGQVSLETHAEKWLRMAGAMDQALDRMREAWKMVDRLCELHKESKCYCRPENWKPLQDEIAAVAVILRVGLKARGRR